jgi:hypothetical protein
MDTSGGWASLLRASYPPRWSSSLTAFYKKEGLKIRECNEKIAQVVIMSQSTD